MDVIEIFGYLHKKKYRRLVKKTKAKNPRCKNPKILFKIFGILLHSRPKFDIIKMIYINFGGGNTVETVAHNLSVLRQRGASVSERRFAHISEAANVDEKYFEATENGKETDVKMGQRLNCG